MGPLASSMARPPFSLYSPDSVRGLCFSSYMNSHFLKGGILSAQHGTGLSHMAEPYQSRVDQRAPTAALHSLLPSAQ